MNIILINKKAVKASYGYCKDCYFFNTECYDEKYKIFICKWVLDELQLEYYLNTEHLIISDLYNSLFISSFIKTSSIKSISIELND